MSHVRSAPALDFVGFEAMSAATIVQDHFNRLHARLASIDTTQQQELAAQLLRMSKVLDQARAGNRVLARCLEATSQAVVRLAMDSESAASGKADGGASSPASKPNGVDQACHSQEILIAPLMSECAAHKVFDDMSGVDETTSWVHAHQVAFQAPMVLTVPAFELFGEMPLEGGEAVQAKQLRFKALGMLDGVAQDVFDEMPIEDVVWDDDLHHTLDSHDLLHHFAQGMEDQMQCKQGYAPEFDGMSHRN